MMTMRKSLLATTAIVGASMLGAAAAQAAEAPVLKLDGFVRVEAKFVDQSYTDSRGQNVHFESDDAGLNLNANGTADNGLRYGAKIEIDTDAANAGIDETRISLAGDWGTLYLGDEDGAQNIMQYGADNNFTAGGGFDGGATSAFNALSVRGGSPNLAGSSGDASKITYYTPRVSGVMLGLSYTPDTGANLASTLSSGDASEGRNHIGVGLNFIDAKFTDDISFRVHGVGQWASADQDSGTIEDIGSYRIGAGLGWMGWNLATSYGDSGDTLRTSGDGSDAGSFWDVSLGYTMGSYKYAVGYFRGKADNASGTDNDETDFFTAQVQYDIPSAPGLIVYAEYDYISVQSPTSTATNLPNNNSGSLVIIGSKVSF